MISYIKRPKALLNIKSRQFARKQLLKRTINGFRKILARLSLEETVKCDRVK